MSETISVTTNAGMIVLFDPILLQERVKSSSSWWKQGPLATSERQEGRLALWPLSSGKATGRSYRIRLGEALLEQEKEYERGVAEATPLRVEGSEVFLGPIERLPGDGAGDRLPALPDQGQLLLFTPGQYTVSAHVLDWRNEERFWDEDNEPTADAPPDIVLLALPCAAELPVAPPKPAPLLSYIPKKQPVASNKVRFASRPRRPIELDPPKKKRASRKKKKAAAPPPKPLKPGELGIGARVHHAVYGDGTVLFMREGFPKARVVFHNTEQKVDKDELRVLS